MHTVDATRSRIMRAVRRANTEPEVLVRKALHGLGLRFRLQGKGLPGTPDIVMPKHKTIVFVHGCFWHRHADCPKATMPKSRVAFWQNKFDRNVERDRRNEQAALDSGWRVMVVWQCETKDRPLLCERLAAEFQR